MRFTAVTASLLILILAVVPAFAGDAVPQILVGIAPADLAPPPPPPGWQEALQMEASSAVTFVPLNTIHIDFSTPKPATLTSVPGEQEYIEVEFKYTPVHIQNLNPVPEPGGIIVFATGIVGLVAHWQRRRLPR